MSVLTYSEVYLFIFSQTFKVVLYLNFQGNIHLIGLWQLVVGITDFPGPEHMTAIESIEWCQEMVLLK